MKISISLKFYFLIILICGLSPSHLLASETEALKPADVIVPETNNKSTFTSYDGSWEIGLGTDFLKQTNIIVNGDSGAYGLSTGFHIGKDFTETKSWIIGGQLHISKSSSDRITGSDDLNFDATTLFATARLKDIPAIQFKLGLARGSYDNFNGHFSESGLVYGLGLVTGDKGLRLHWLDYEVYELENDKFESISISLVVWFCLFGGCA